MTTTAEPTRARRRSRREQTPESERLAELNEMLASGRYAGYTAELQAEVDAELARLGATVLEA